MFKLKKYQEIILGFSAVIFIAVIFWFYFWGIKELLVNLSHAIDVGKTEENTVQFDLENAKIILEGRNLLE